MENGTQTTREPDQWHTIPDRRRPFGRPGPGDLRRRFGMKVWIDQDLCTGDGLCVDRCPDVFVMLEDGIAYVRDEHGVHNQPGGSRDPANVHPDNEDDVIDAAMICPGECIFIEVETSVTDQPVLAGSSHG